MKLKLQRTIAAILAVVLFWLWTAWVLLDGTTIIGKMGRQLIAVTETNLHDGTWMQVGIILLSVLGIVVIPVCIIGACCYLIGRWQALDVKTISHVPATPNALKADAKSSVQQTPDGPRFGKNSRFKSMEGL